MQMQMQMQKKKKKVDNIFCVWNNCIWNCCYQLSLLRKDYQLLGVNGLRNSLKFLYIKRDRPFPTELPSEWSINMVNVLSFRLQQCSGPFTLLLVEVSSETRLFGHLSNFYLRSLWEQKYSNYEGHLFFSNVQNWM